jgi:hypothetical protein
MRPAFGTEESPPWIASGSLAKPETNNITNGLLQKALKEYQHGESIHTVSGPVPAGSNVSTQCPTLRYRPPKKNTDVPLPKLESTNP